VVSVKPRKFTGLGSVGVFVRGNTLDAEHVSLDDLVWFTYNLRGVQLSGGPAWAKSGILMYSALFQGMAKVSSDPPPLDQFRKMLQPVLAGRFHLQVHHVLKNLPTYNLVVAKAAPNSSQATPDRGPTSTPRAEAALVSASSPPT
jgi:uncharacterized protein (TIGR03435 family)